MPIIKKHLKQLERSLGIEKDRRKYLRLDMNENVTGLPDEFVKLILKEVDSKLLAMYPEYDTLKDIIARHNNIKANNIYLSNGSDAAIKSIFEAYISKGDNVLITNPTFAMYPIYCEIFQAVSLVANYKSNFSFPKEKFLEMISKNVKMAVIVNPNNPTGTILTKSELLEIIKKAAINDVLLIIDEAYYYYYPETMINQIDIYNNIIILRTFSKLCGIAGLRLGYAAACPDIIVGLNKVKSSFEVNALSLLYAERLLEKPSIIKKMIDEFRDGKEYLIQELREESISYEIGYGNFILIKCGKRTNEIKMKLANDKILVKGGFKQDFLKQYLRITIGRQKEMKRFWISFQKIWNNNKK